MANNTLIFCFFLLLLTSCSPQKKLRKLQKKHPELFEQVEIKTMYRDTIIDTITVTLESIADSATFDRVAASDTDSNIEQQGNDFFVQETDDFKTTVEIRKVRDFETGAVKERLKIKTIVKERVITKEVPFFIEKEIEVPVDCPKCEQKSKFWWFVFAWLFGLFGGVWFYNWFLVD